MRSVLAIVALIGSIQFWRDCDVERDGTHCDLSPAEVDDWRWQVEIRREILAGPAPRRTRNRGFLLPASVACGAGGV